MIHIGERFLITWEIFFILRARFVTSLGLKTGIVRTNYIKYYMLHIKKYHDKCPSVRRIPTGQLQYSTPTLLIYDGTRTSSNRIGTCAQYILCVPKPRARA
jgi:hypothetical protein